MHTIHTQLYNNKIDTFYMEYNSDQSRHALLVFWIPVGFHKSILPCYWGVKNIYIYI